MNTTPTVAAPADEKVNPRIALANLTEQVRLMQAKGQLPQGSANQALVAFYALQGKTNLKTMTGWNEQGMKIKKGSKALWVWAKPRKAAESDKDAMDANQGQAVSEDEKRQYSFFPMAKLFAAEDVESMPEKMRAFVAPRLAKYGRKLRALEFGHETA